MSAKLRPAMTRQRVDIFLRWLRDNECNEFFAHHLPGIYDEFAKATGSIRYTPDQVCHALRAFDVATSCRVTHRSRSGQSRKLTLYIVRDVADDVAASAATRLAA